jgi:hypothetical protein
MPVSQQIAELVDMLPGGEQLFALEFIKRLVLAWDVDYTKLTPDEAAALDEGLEQVERGEVVSAAELRSMFKTE